MSKPRILRNRRPKAIETPEVVHLFKIYAQSAGHLSTSLESLNDAFKRFNENILRSLSRMQQKSPHPATANQKPAP